MSQCIFLRMIHWKWTREQKPRRDETLFPERDSCTSAPIAAFGMRPFSVGDIRLRIPIRITCKVNTS
jgi:hypothetical protein